ncbi:MAG TPA: hypothetical protein VHR45_09430 [Thermoanaerobaculia bacterium]|nr:hypothetical protein [Thermoanaerobaculia bacterium]
MALTCGLVAVSAGAAVVTQDSGGDLKPTGKGWGVHQGSAVAIDRLVRGNGINYHGGPVMLGTTHIYNIWYGNWSSNSATTILTDLANHIGGSAYFNINTTYYDGSNRHVSNSVTYNGDTFDSYSQGSNIDDNGVFAIVVNAINSGALPLDSHGVYFVLTSADVNETTGFCTVYCGWHTDGTVNGTDVKFSFVGNPDACPSACEGIPGNHPNNNAGADGMASIIAHELEESVTDPDLNAWYDSRGNENGDKCAYNYGSEYTTSNGSKANIHLGTRDYLIQRNWVNAKGGYCSIKYP